jgi:hypothetical protein
MQFVSSTATDRFSVTQLSSKMRSGLQTASSRGKERSFHEGADRGEPAIDRNDLSGDTAGLIAQ